MLPTSTTNPSATGANEAHEGSINPITPSKKVSKVVFVTVGATASFRPLIEEVLSEKVLAKLAALRFTHLIVQCGPDLEYFERVRPELQLPGEGDGKLQVSGFGYTRQMEHYMRLATAGTDDDNEDVKGERGEGLIITHAGSGSLLEALPLGTNIIAVPNTSLMGNHQAEIAIELEKDNYVIHGKIGQIDQAIDGDKLKALKKDWPGEEDPDSVFKGGLWEIINFLMPRD
ncbi:glycosyltransferase family 1 protein [Whalleya microplaca]|nr:glycosyltransferase family 1 protein [Whalleya microplaca]